MSFVGYVLKHKRQDTPLGDVARDIILDPRINRRWGFRSLIEHIENNHSCCDAVINILNHANDSFEVAKAVKRMNNLGVLVHQ
jgi:hypothetical protein